MIKIYTDGSCKFNPGPGGYALIIVQDDDVKDICQAYLSHTTNNQMELLGVRDAILYCIKNNILECQIYSDSQYTVLGINEWMDKWKRKNWHGSKHSVVANVEIWKEMNALWHQARQKLNISIHYVKGHADNKYNNLADEMAREIISKHDRN